MGYMTCQEAKKIPDSELRQRPDSPERFWTNAQISAMTEVQLLRAMLDWERADFEREQMLRTSVPEPWTLGRYDADVAVVPSRYSQLSGYAIAFNVVSQPMEGGWREVVRPSALADAVRYRTPLWVQHRSEFVVDPDVRLSADEHGLRVESFGAARHDRALHASVLKLIDDGTLYGMSIHLPRAKCGYHEYPETMIREFYHIPFIPEVSLARGPKWPGTTVKATDQWLHARQRSFDPYTHERLQAAVGG